MHKLENEFYHIRSKIVKLNRPSFYQKPSPAFDRLALLLRRAKSPVLSGRKARNRGYLGKNKPPTGLALNGSNPPLPSSRRRPVAFR